MSFSTAAGASALEEMQSSFPLSGTSKGLRKLCIADMFSQHASHTFVLQHVSGPCVDILLMTLTTCQPWNKSHLHTELSHVLFVPISGKH